MQNACAVLYYHLWPVWFYRILPHFLINGTVLGGGEGGVTESKVCVLIFSITLIFLIIRRTGRDIGINVYISVFN